jgi:hypothetical protein
MYEKPHSQNTIHSLHYIPAFFSPIRGCSLKANFLLNHDKRAWMQNNSGISPCIMLIGVPSSNPLYHLTLPFVKSMCLCVSSFNQSSVLFPTFLGTLLLLYTFSNFCRVFIYPFVITNCFLYLNSSFNHKELISAAFSSRMMQGYPFLIFCTSVFTFAVTVIYLFDKLEEIS